MAPVPRNPWCAVYKFTRGTASWGAGYKFSKWLQMAPKPRHMAEGAVYKYSRKHKPKNPALGARGDPILVLASDDSSLLVGADT